VKEFKMYHSFKFWNDAMDFLAKNPNAKMVAQIPKIIVFIAKELPARG
jgi:hypothetical protein